MVERTYATNCRLGLMPMTSNKNLKRTFYLSFFLLLFINACQKSSESALSEINCDGTIIESTPVEVQAVGKNVMPVKVGSCGPHSYVNEPCVSVTICDVNDSNHCQT